MKKFFIFKLMFLMFFFNYSKGAELKYQKEERTSEFRYAFYNYSYYPFPIEIIFDDFTSQEIKLDPAIDGIRSHSIEVFKFFNKIDEIRLKLDNKYLIWKIYPLDQQEIFINYSPEYNTFELTYKLNECLHNIIPTLCKYYLKMTDSCDTEFYRLENLTSSILNLEIILKTAVLECSIEPGNKKMIPFHNGDYEIQSILIKETNQRFNKYEFGNKKFSKNIGLSMCVC